MRNNMKFTFVLLVALSTVGCTGKVATPATPATPAQISTYSPVITGRACVNGKSMIRVNFGTNEAGFKQQADIATWVYEYTDTYQSYVKTC